MHKSSLIKVACECGQSVTMRAWACVDIATEPGVLKEMEKGRFHNRSCGNCGTHIQLDKWFLFQDSARNLLIHVFPVEYRQQYHDLREQLEPLHSLCGIESPSSVKLVFGLSDLMAFLRGDPTHLPPVLFSKARTSRARATVN